MNKSSIEKEIEEIQLMYGYGQCAPFAVALSQIYNLPIVEFYAGQEMYHVALLMEAKEEKNDRFIDVLGINSNKDIKNRYSMPGKKSIEVRTENELHQMSMFTKEEVILAKKDALFLIQHKILPELEILNLLASQLKEPKKDKPKVSLK